jgi:TonB-linked SusC/RagA family outer membrane protein
MDSARGTFRRQLARGLTLVSLFAASAAAQTTGVVRGRVIDNAQRPVPEVTITVTGTTIGTITNENGEYTLGAVPAGSRTIVTRRLGYARATRTLDVTAGGEARADFTLSQSVTQLNEIVTTGTAGSVERKTVGNSITTIDVSAVADKASVSNIMEVMQGKSPGLTVLPGSGVPGTGEEIRIRGTASLSGYKPVVYVDGLRYNIDDLGGFGATGGGTLGLAQSTQITSALHNLNPSDIESIEIIKGPAAATLYGAEAAGGVIQIFTKKGRRGQQALRWTVRNEMGSTSWNLIPEDNYTTCDAVKQAATSVVNGVTVPTWRGCQGLPVNTVISDNPLRRDSRALRDGELNRFSLNVSGGGDRYSFYGGAERDNETGVFYNSDNSRTNLRTNFSFSPNEKSDFAVNVNWSDGRLRLPIQDESANGLLLSARRGQAGRISFFTDTSAWGWRTITPTAANRYKNYTENDRFTLGATLNYTPLSWFRNRFTAGFDQTNTQAQLLFLPGDIDQSQDPDAASGANLRRVPQRRILTLDYVGTGTWQATQDLLSTTSFGSQVTTDRFERIDATGIGIGAPDVTLIGLLQRSTGGEQYSENNSVGYYVQEQLGWKDRLFVTGAIRADDHSSFGTNFDVITYPKLSVSYVVSEEPAAKPFLESARITSLQLRGAWGQAGRAPSAYSAPQTYTIGRVTLGPTTGSSLFTAAYGNPDLKPERGSEIELGFEAGLLNDRLGLDMTYYNKSTTDVLQSIAIAPSTGFGGSRLTNLGEVKNAGIELSIYGSPLTLENVQLESRLNYFTNTNELVSFGIADKTFETPGGQAYGAVQQHRQGYPLGGFWLNDVMRCGVNTAPAGTTPCTAADSAGRAAIVTTAGAAVFTTGETNRVYFGSPTPTREIGFSNTLTLFRYFRLYALLDHKGGHKVFNLQERNRCQTANDNCARVNNPSARFPVTGADSVLFREIAVYRSGSVSPEWIQPADFTKLREVSLTIDVPKRYVDRAKLGGASIMFAARNLAVWSDYEGVDPEVNSYGGRNFVRVDAYAAPMMRRYTTAINLQF